MTGKEAVVLADLDGGVGRRGQGLQLGADPPLRRLGQDHPVRLVPCDGAADFPRQISGIVRILEIDIVDRHALPPQGLGKMAHGRQDQHDLLPVVGHMGVLPHDLRHQDNVTDRVEPLQRRHIAGQLVAQHNSQHGRGP